MLRVGGYSRHRGLKPEIMIKLVAITAINILIVNMLTVSVEGYYTKEFTFASVIYFTRGMGVFCTIMPACPAFPAGFIRAAWRSDGLGNPRFASSMKGGKCIYCPVVDNRRQFLYISFMVADNLVSAFPDGTQILLVPRFTGFSKGQDSSLMSWNKFMQ